MATQTTTNFKKNPRAVSNPSFLQLMWSLFRSIPGLFRSINPRSYDWILVGIVGLLLVIGLIMVYSTTFDWSYSDTGNPAHFLGIQARNMLFGLVVLVVAAVWSPRYFRLLAIVSTIGTLVALVLLLFVGSMQFNAVRSLLDGSYQPSEAAKLAIILYLSVWLHGNADNIDKLWLGLFPYACIIGAIAGVIFFQPDFSAALTIVIIGLFLYLLAGVGWRQILVSGAVGTVAFIAAYYASATVKARISGVTTGLTDITESSYHVQQVFIALASGGIFGRGIGSSYIKFTSLPTAHTDSIFAVIGEELGLIGCLVVIGLFVALIWRGARIALKSRDRLGAYLAGGITFWIAFEALVNIGSMLGLVPFAGNALPFISYGGSSLVVTLAGVGLLLNLSRTSEGEPIQQRQPRAIVNQRRWNWRSRVSGTSRDK